MHLSERRNNLRMPRVYDENLVQSNKRLTLATYTLCSQNETIAYKTSKYVALQQILGVLPV